MTTTKRILSIFVAGVMLIATMLSLTACGESTKVAMTIDGYDVNAGVYIYYLNTAYYELESTLNPNGDTDFDVHSKTHEEKSANQWISDRAVELCAKHVAVIKEAEKLNVTLDTETSNYITSMVDYYWDNYGYSEVFGKMGVSKESFKAGLSNSYLEGAVFEKVYGKGGEKEISSAELLTFMTDNYVRTKYYSLSKIGSDKKALPDVEIAKLKATANDLIAMINSGTPYDKMIDEYEKLQKEIADASKDTDSDVQGGTIELDTSDTDTEKDPYERETMVYKESTYPTEEFVKMLFEKTAADHGKTFLYEDDSAFYIVQVLNTAERTDYLEDNYSSVLSYYKFDEYDKTVDELAKTLTVERNEQAIKRYEPKKLGVPA